MSPLYNFLIINCPAPWRQGSSINRAWFNIGDVKVEVTRKTGPIPYWISIKTAKGVTLGSSSRVVLEGLPDALPAVTASAVLRALEIGKGLRREDVPDWAHEATLKALHAPCTIPRTPAWQARIDDLAAEMEPT